MAGHGPAPKPASQRRRRNKVEPGPQVAIDGRVRGPRLPDVRPDGEPYSSETRYWWDTWRRSPQAQVMQGTDWESLKITAIMHDTVVGKGRWEFAAELRIREAKLGATIEDRARLKIQVEQPEPAVVATGTDGTVTDIASRRSRLTED